jgi:hypothetical protein
MKKAYSDLALLIRWCVSFVLAIIVAIPMFTSVTYSI